MRLRVGHDGGGGHRERLRLRVLFITSWYPIEEQPVSGVFVREHAKAVRLHDDVVVLHCAGPDPRPGGLWRFERVTDGALTEDIPTYRVWYRRSPIPGASYFIYLWSVFRAFRRILKQGVRPDVIHAHVYEAGLPAVLIGRVSRIPVVISEHFTAFPRKSLSRREIMKARVAFRGARMVLPVSRALQGAIESYGIRARFRVVPNVVDTSVFFPAVHESEDSKPKRLLFVGLMDSSHKKGVPYLLEALVRLRAVRDDWQLDLVGDGPARAQYERMAADLGIAEKVTFHGLKSKPEVARFMHQADLLVSPSVVETFGVVVAEALAAGLPVIATRSGGPDEYVTERLGRLVPSADVPALATALAETMDRLGGYSHHDISHFALQHFGQGRVGALLHSTYQDLCNSTLDEFRAGNSGRKIRIAKDWRVLDLGSGHLPHSRADVLLDRTIGPHAERSARPAFRDGRPFVQSDAQCLPFRESGFDFVIASHIAEHVPDPAMFCAELQRVAPRGYIECPGPLGELLLGERFHLWVVRRNRNGLTFWKKKRQRWSTRVVSGLFYALFYAGQERGRRTFHPKVRGVRRLAFESSRILGKVWRSPLLRRWTYSCLEFDRPFDCRVEGRVLGEGC